MNKYLKNLNRIEFVVTTACTGRCKHCSQGEDRCALTIDKNKASDAVRKIAKEYNITSVMTFGGEALLYPETVCEIHNAAREMNVEKRQLITNGYFSKDYDKIRSVVKQLVESGVNEILISADAFHQETIPLEYVKAFAKAAAETDAEVRMNPAWLVGRESDNEYNLKTRKILNEFSCFGIETGEGNTVFPAGNALKYLNHYFDLANLPENPYEENPEDITAVCFSANGDILSSNIYEKDISEILNFYTP